MKKIVYLSLALTGLATTRCENAEKNNTEELKSIDVAYMNTTVSPQEDFYRFANGQWLKDNPVPDSEARWGSFNEVKDRNDSIIKGIIKNASEKTDWEKGSPNQLIGDYYSAILDKEGRDNAGTGVLEEIFAEIDGATLETLPAILAKHNQHGIGGLFGFSIFEDLKENTKYSIYFGQTGFGLPDKDYYFNEDEKSVETREEYKKHVTKMMELAGVENAQAAMEQAYNVEEWLASASMNATEQRNIPALYNKYSYADFTALCPSFNFTNFIEATGATTEETVIVMQPNYYRKLQEVLTNHFDEVKTYLKWNATNSLASKLNSDLDQQNFAFYGKYLSGSKEQKEMWKRAIDDMTGNLGEVLGKAYVDVAFSDASKQKVNEMVDNLQAALKERLENLDWMSDSTKEKAMLKMASFNRKLGFPDKWKDFSKLDISRASYAKNWMSAQTFQFEEMIAKQGQPIDKDEWGMPAHMVNAYYSPLKNEIVFPAGIMQPPFFNPNAEDAVNYARMGAVIGHEMIHGFDDNGARFNHAGSMQNWWNDDDTTKFNARTKKLVEQYNTFQVIPDVHVNGELTLGENIADFGGLTIAYNAYQKSLEGKERDTIAGFNNNQRFFISFAQIWKGNATDEFLRKQVKTDPHSPTEFRVNGTLANMPEFFEAFDVKEGDAMRQGQDKIAVIW